MFIMYILLFIPIGLLLFYSLKKDEGEGIGEVQDALLSPEELEKHAAEIASIHQIAEKPSRKTWIVPRMNDNYRYIESVYKRLNEDLKNEKIAASAAEWLLDNFYIIEQQVKEIRRDLSKKHYLQLPVLKSGPFKGYPRIYAIAMELVAHSDGRFDEKGLIRFIESYQTKALLSSGELWAVAIMVRIVLIENIRQICEKIFVSQQHFKLADTLADKIIENLGQGAEVLLQILKDGMDKIDKISPSFVEHLIKKLRSKQHDDLIPLMQYLDERLYEQDTTAEKMIQQEHQEQAAMQISMGNSITSLRLVSTLDWSVIFESLYSAEQILRKDPAGVYPQMDFNSRDYYRCELEKLAGGAGVTETQVARKAVECASEHLEQDDVRLKHVGYYLIGKGRETLKKKIGYREKGAEKLLLFLKRYSVFFYLGCILLITLGLVWIVFGCTRNTIQHMPGAWRIIAAIALLLSASDVAVHIVNWLCTRFSRPALLPKMELRDGIPESAATMVVIPTLLPNEERVKQLLEQIEVYYLANREKNLYFAIVGDYKDAAQEKLPGDEKILETAVAGIRELNNRYASEDEDIFYFFHRRRQYNRVQNKWMGWERKRGALVELNDLLRGRTDTSFCVVTGDLSRIQHIKYIITLDADTRLPKDAAKRLIGTMSHPLNKPVIDEKRKIVVEGYGLLQPRINVDIISANSSLFSQIFAGQGGVDPYTTAVSDIYQDIFGEGIFTGKGIYDLDVFRSVLENAIPDNRVLSHDLLEGSYVRTGLASDIDLIDGYPAKYSAFIARLHRWVRGDWQLLPWLAPHVLDRTGRKVKNPLSLLSKWKIFDNLRRSLVAPAQLLTIVFAFGMLAREGTVWLLFVLLTLCISLVSTTVDGILLKHYRFCREKRHCTIIYGCKAVVYQVLLMFMFLPYQAYMMGDAILRTLFRVFITKRNTLEWVTAADAEKRLKNDVLSYWKRMSVSVLLGAAPLVLSVQSKSSLWPVAFALFLIWSAAPFIAYAVSRTEEKMEEPLAEEDVHLLRCIARKTWGYFEDFMGEEDNYLPPDNYQEDPPNGIAHRTSPTNIGLACVSTLAARDLGYIGLKEMEERLNNTITTVERMDKWKGHLYNWYNTRTLEVLRPRYISTVDSGNFIAYLMTLKQGLRDCINRPLASAELARGLKDTILIMKEQEEDIAGLDIKVLEEVMEEEHFSLLKWSKVLDVLLDKLENKTKDKSPWAKKVHHMLLSFKADVNALVPWIDMLKSIPEVIEKERGKYSKVGREIKEILEKLLSNPSMAGLKDTYAKVLPHINTVIDLLRGMQKKNTAHDEAVAWIYELKGKMEKGNEENSRLLGLYKTLMDRIQVLIDNTPFGPLFDSKRQLFSIGYNIEEERLTKSYYDLFASEARQTSFIAIARGEVDQKHWLHLGRNLTMVDGYKGLVSWTGTMFEYLMPLLIMKNYKNTLWDETYRFVMASQRKYGRQRQVPWGTSESGYYSFDINLNYQYKAFGVPELGLKRGLSSDMVVAPYATVMALMVDPLHAAENMRRLKEEGAEGPYGFYEAIDYTTQRLPNNEHRSIVKSFMAHHQGMSMMALVNYLKGNVMQKRFHEIPIIRSVELLLQERIPVRVILTKEYKERIEPFKKREQQQEETVRIFDMPEPYVPAVHILSNGQYCVALTDRGTGYSRNQGIAVTRWREDGPMGNFGTFFYIQNLNSNNVWSATYGPYHDKPEKYKVIFSPDKAEFIRKDGNIDTHTEIVVSSEENAEVRRISLTNHSEHSRTVEVTSYLEVVLTHQSADVAHPAFSNLFVRTEYLPEYNCLLANRRPREEGKSTLWGVHSVLVEGELIGDIQYETDRSKFIGRGRDLSNPQALDVDKPLSQTVGPVLDPIMSLRCRVRIKPGETVRVTYVTGTSDKKEELIKIAQKYQDAAAVARAFELAWTRSQVENRYLGLASEEEKIIQEMTSHLLFPSPLRRKQESMIQKNTKGQPALWAYGISGDLPIVLVVVGNENEIDIVRQMLKAHEYWRMKGLEVDLVLLNEDEGSYMQPLQGLIRDIVSVSHARELQDRPGGVFIRSGKTMPEEDKILLFTAARIVIRGDISLKDQIVYKIDESEFPAIKEWKEKEEVYSHPWPECGNLLFYNGWGGFSPDGREYVIKLKEAEFTPAPWINVISNPQFGFQITELGGGYTWAENSRENKLTPWSNDAVSDPNGEVIYLRDEHTGAFWTVTPLPVRKPGPYIVRHGYGYSVFEHVSHGLEQQLTLFVPKDAPVKIQILRLKNLSKKERNIKATYYLRPVLGVSDQNTAPYIATTWQADKGILFIRNRFNGDCPGRVVFMDSSVQERTVTGDRTEFLGPDGRLSEPAAMKRETLSNRTGAGFDPCAAMQVNVHLNEGEEKKIIFLLGQGMDEEEALALSREYTNIEKAEQALRLVQEFWQEKLGAVKVKTPDLSMDLLLNGWLIYQTLSCRIWSRSAFYQCGGAYGFRDQLQDVMALLYVLPGITRRQILKHAAHQFVEGDVQHWWHPVAWPMDGADKGIRTRFSDDLVWLPYVTADYIEKTGDWDILHEEVPYIEDEPLKEGEDERYNIPRISNEKSSLYEHCIRAIEKACNFGSHGIPLMGSGDWNDGMSTVGNKGKGESVWLGWFLYTTLMRFIPICKAMQDDERAEKYKNTAEKLVKSMEANAWDGAWYRRAYFDDGTPLGSSQNMECKIDSIAQSWSVISGAGKPSRTKEAMSALEHYLVKKEEGLIMLLTPPFDKGELKPGYIKGYVPGVRENGGQYTHAAIWVIMAFAKMGDGDKAWELFHLINPINHARTPIEAARYKVEPYVMAADVYAVHPHTGRGGWTWYTGAAGWMYRVGIEHILGLKKKGDRLIIDPCIPKEWDYYEMEYKYGDTQYVMRVKNPKHVNKGVQSIMMDKNAIENYEIPLIDDKKTHFIDVTMG
ncbi:MAG: glycosyl transferase [Clostridiaceae bacterium]|nr:glycosyl transferase [Clostridiaceae bacterium]